MSLLFDRWTMISILQICLFQTSYSLLIVWHIIYDLPSICLCLPQFNSVLIVRHFICEHRCFCLCHPEINTVSVMFDISSMLTVVCDCFFHSSIPYHIVRHIIHDYTSFCLCFPELNIVSLLFDTWSMIIIVNGRVFQNFIPCLYCLTYHLWPSFFMSVSSRVQ